MPRFENLVKAFHTFDIIDHDGPLNGEIRASSFAVAGMKALELPQETIESALRFEFDLPLPDRVSYARGQDVWNAYKSCLSKQ